MEHVVGHDRKMMTKKKKYHQFHSYVSTKVHVVDQETIHYWHQEFKSELLSIAVGQEKKEYLMKKKNI